MHPLQRLHCSRGTSSHEGPPRTPNAHARHVDAIEVPVGIFGSERNDCRAALTLWVGFGDIGQGSAWKHMQPSGAACNKKCDIPIPPKQAESGSRQKKPKVPQRVMFEQSHAQPGHTCSRREPEINNSTKTAVNMCMDENCYSQNATNRCVL